MGKCKNDFIVYFFCICYVFENVGKKFISDFNFYKENVWVYFLEFGVCLIFFSYLKLI